MGSCFSVRIKAESPPRWASSFTSSSNAKSSSRKEVNGDGFSSSHLKRDHFILESSNLKKFTFNELKSATRNFRPDSVIGHGGFGGVYKGWIDEQSLAATKPGEGLCVAVKRLNREGLQGHREWLAEVNCLGQLDHPNLVKLIGYCLKDDQRLLVYEFMSKGSLDNHLFRRSSHFQPLSWNIRMKIALDAAKGLAYLHRPEAKVIYRDLKTSNVLLDSNYNAKLSDFGLAKEGPTGTKSDVSTRILGTPGYAAPEYLATGHVSIRSDVYSFGVVLLELITGQRSIDEHRPHGQHCLVKWMMPRLSSKHKVLRIFDPRMEGQYSEIEAYKAAALAIRCLSLQPKHRPRMEEVVRALEQLLDDRDVPGVARPEENTSASAVRGSAQKSEGNAANMRNGTTDRGGSSASHHAH